MELTSSGLILASMLVLRCGRLNVRPDRTMFFRHSKVTFSCSDSSAGQGHWGVKRNTSMGSSEPCESGWGRADGSSCTVEGLYTSDSGLYWCETELNQRSSAVNITVTSDPVILSAPARPVLQGEPFSLLCLYKERGQTKHSIDFLGAFFRNGEFIGKWSPANMTITAATQNDRGLYRCEHPTRGRSMDVPLTVVDRPALPRINETTSPPPPPPPLASPTVPLFRWLCFAFLFLLYTVILCIGLCVYCKWTRARAEAKQRRADLVL